AACLAAVLGCSRPGQPAGPVAPSMAARAAAVAYLAAQAAPTPDGEAPAPSPDDNRPKPKPGDTCYNCSGSGKSGDGLGACKPCGGDGRIDVRDIDPKTLADVEPWSGSVQPAQPAADPHAQA